MLATLLKVTILHGCFSRFLNLTNGIKSRKASHIQTSLPTGRINQLIDFYNTRTLVVDGLTRFLKMLVKMLISVRNHFEGNIKLKNATCSFLTC